MALVEVYACLNMSIISATFGFAEGRGDIEVGVADGRGLFMTSAMLGLHFVSLLLGVGGWMARCEALPCLPRVAKSVSIERFRVFFREGVGPAGRE